MIKLSLSLTALVLSLVGLAPAAWASGDIFNHANLEELKQPFKSGPEVTKTCLSCHDEAGTQIMKTIHWTWMSPYAPSEAKLGKGGLLINNLCIAMPSNEPRCTSCHAGYGWKDKSFDFTKQENIDCLVCHEQTGTYKKFPAGAGNPVSEPKQFGAETFQPPDWNKVAQSVGRSTRNNCGGCHFYGGGGDMVKHGDLDSSIKNPERSLDVHMDAKGANFSCTSCHTTVAHNILGETHRSPIEEGGSPLLKDDRLSRLTCESCHSDAPHKPGAKANDHSDKVACQTCHIPAFARKLPTKMRWDWATAGQKDEEDKPLKKKGPLGLLAYDGMKGDFEWQQNVTPVYQWFNGYISHVMAYSKIDPSQPPVTLTKIEGEPSDPTSRIYPFKLHTGRQPYDTQNHTMVVTKLFGPPGSGAYWSEYDWDKAITAGMTYVGLPFSGKFDFIETKYYFQISHMVAPKEQAVSCKECHTVDSRLKGITGVYLPGRDFNRPLNYIGWGVAVAALLSVCLHGLKRTVARRKNDKQG
jgi:octaheme c-type cytochrome (tetrathionate reductase family)